MVRFYNRVTDLERKYVSEVLDSQFRTSDGSMMTGRLEAAFAQLLNCKYAISFVNGTATMHAALVAAGVGPGDEVIVPPLTMASTAFSVLQAGALPVFADIDQDTWTLSPQAIKACITPHTKAIIAVSIYGLAPDLDPIIALSKKNNLFLLEDDAQCVLGTYKGRVVGSIGDASSFSFQSSKHLTSGEGGMITTNDQKLADDIRRFNSLGYAAVGAEAGKGKITRETIQDPAYERHASMGFNYRMAELCAAVMLAQTERARELVEMRLEVARMYNEATEGCPWLVPQKVPEGRTHTYWTYSTKLENGREFSWYDFRNKYAEISGEGIYAAWQLNYLEPAFRGLKLADYQIQKFGKGLCPAAEDLQPKLLQFKTNFYQKEEAEKAAEALRKTIRSF